MLYNPGRIPSPTMSAALSSTAAANAMSSSSSSNVKSAASSSSSSSVLQWGVLVGVAASAASALGYYMYKKHKKEQLDQQFNQLFEEVRLSNEQQVQQQVNDGAAFPLVLSPKNNNNDQLPLTLDEWATTLKSQKQTIMNKLTKHGAVLFRDFPLATAEHLLQFITAFEFEYGTYIGGGGPRKVVLGPIHNSTDSPPDSVIPFHHELAYLTSYPSMLAFYCVTPSQDKGETPLLLSNRLYNRIKEANPKFVEQVEKKKIIYTRVMADQAVCDGKFQRSWQLAFETEDRKLAEQRAYDTGAKSVEWLEDKSMKVVSKPLESLQVDPRTNKPTWFNSIILLHPAAQDKAKNAPWSVTYGDGSPIADEDVLQAKQFMQEECIAFRWQKGDVLFVDNRLALHARNTFTPPRLILAAIVK